MTGGARHLAGAYGLAGALLVGCVTFMDVDCGPLPADACRARVAQIQAVIADELPGRRIVSVEIVNEEGHASVRLDDGTEVGFGERLGSSGKPGISRR